MSRPAKPARQTWYTRAPAEFLLCRAAPALLAAAWRSHHATWRCTLTVPLRPKTKSWVGVLEGGLEAGQRDRGGVDALIGERHEHVAEAEDRVVPEIHAPADGERVVARAYRAETEDRGDGMAAGRARDRTAGARIVARLVEEAGGSEAGERLAAEEGERERGPIPEREVEAGSDPTLAHVDVIDHEVEAAVHEALKGDRSGDRNATGREVEQWRELPRARSLEVLLAARRHAHHEAGRGVTPRGLQKAVLAAQEHVADAGGVRDVLLEPSSTLLGRDRHQAVVVRIARERVRHRAD